MFPFRLSFDVWRKPLYRSLVWATKHMSIIMPLAAMLIKGCKNLEPNHSTPEAKAMMILGLFYRDWIYSPSLPLPTSQYLFWFLPPANSLEEDFAKWRKGLFGSLCRLFDLPFDGGTQQPEKVYVNYSAFLAYPIISNVSFDISISGRHEHVWYLSKRTLKKAVKPAAILKSLAMPLEPLLLPRKFYPT